ncbi:protoporphyrinogen oxidase [Plasmodium cynomolgi strain B]|uniref:Protoporphyrinogen oxidase n=1 Tax=Plasmodium cynomolgi (strain B) TaxID=1120755 RepID=K6UTS6_PLACD|nr:protoporphyrinogen oxidase [Plasmodium cynomolgi strain B]GAB65490.1 protoporphyrinogen oxidase [Plasmodium cynomolgi strain B]
MGAREGGGEAGVPAGGGEAGLAAEPGGANASCGVSTSSTSRTSIEPEEPDEDPPNEQHTYDVIIIGGGLFSCCLYYFLKRKNRDIKILILEKEQTLGGYIKTEWLEDQGKNFLCELGPNIFKISEESYQLLNELNLLSHVRVLNRKLLSVTNKVKLIYKLLFKRYKELRAYDEDISVEEYMRENFDLQHYNFLLLPLIYGSCGGVGSISAVSFFSRNLKLFDNKLNTLRVWQERMGGGVCRVDSLSRGEVGCDAPPPNEEKTPNREKHISVSLQHSCAQRMNQKYDLSSSFNNNVLHTQDMPSGDTMGDTAEGDTLGGDLIGRANTNGEASHEHANGSHENSSPANVECTTKHHAGMDTMKSQPDFMDTPAVEMFLHFVKRIYAKCKCAILQAIPLLYTQLAKKGSKEYEQKKKKS